MDEYERAAMRMQQYGGRFSKLIGAAYMAADAENRKPLPVAYPGLFAMYDDQFGEIHERNTADAYDYTDRTARATDCSSDPMRGAA